MRFALLLATVALIPIAAVGGYFAHQEPAPPALPAFGPYVGTELGIRHVPGMDSDDWLAVAVTGPNKGGAMAVLDAFSMWPTQRALEAGAGGKVKYYEVKCGNYSSGRDKDLIFTAPTTLRKCSAALRTRTQARKYLVSQAKQVQG